MAQASQTWLHTTYFEGISSPPKPLTDEEKRRAEENYKLEQQQRYNERQIRKYKRLSEYTLDPQERQKYAARLEQWQRANAKLVEEHGDVLRRRYEREVARDLRVKVPAPPSANFSLKSLDKSLNSGIIKETYKYIDDAFGRNLLTTSAKSGSNKFSAEAKKLLLQKEAEISSNKFETAVIYSSEGKYLSSSIGSEDSINFLAEDYEYIRDGAILTHNHPNSTVPSANDIAFLLCNNISEIRACNTRGAYSIKKKGNWKASKDEVIQLKNEIQRKFFAYSNELVEEYKEGSAKLGKPIYAFLKEIDEKAVSRICKDYNLEFSWEERN